MSFLRVSLWEKLVKQLLSSYVKETDSFIKRGLEGSISFLFFFFLDYFIVTENYLLLSVVYFMKMVIKSNTQTIYRKRNETRAASPVFKKIIIIIKI